MKVSLIAAVAENGVIGKDNDLPWSVKDDMKFFVDTTRGHVVIMGRRNYSAMGAPLPKRTNVVVSRKPGLELEGCIVVRSIEEALRVAEDHGELEAFVIGGAEIYRLALPYAHRFYRTRILAKVEGDVFFPQIDEEAWNVEELARHDADERNEHPFVIEKLTAKEAPRRYD